MPFILMYRNILYYPYTGWLHRHMRMWCACGYVTSMRPLACGFSAEAPRPGVLTPPCHATEPCPAFDGHASAGASGWGCARDVRARVDCAQGYAR